MNNPVSNPSDNRLNVAAATATNAVSSFAHQICDGQAPVGGHYNADVSKAMQDLDMIEEDESGTDDGVLAADASQFRQKIASILQSKAFAVFTLVIILCDIGLIMMETDRLQKCDAKLAQMKGCKDAHVLALLATWTILIMYIIEVGVRLYTYRENFHKDYWNILDLSVCILSFFYLLGGLFTFKVRPLRIFRVFRLARIAKFIVGFRELYLVKAGLGSMLRVLFWSSLLLLLMLIFASVAAVEFIYPVAERLTLSGDCDRCWKAFSSVWRTVLTFFHMFILGDDWADVGIPIMEKAPGTGIIFVGMALLVFLGVGNLIMAIIVERAAEAREEDKVYQKSLQVKMDFEKKKDLLEACIQLDSNQDGTLSLDELQSLCHKHGGAEAFRSLNLAKEDLECIFSCIDVDGSGDVSYAEFVDAVFKMRNADVAFMLMFIKSHVVQLQKTITSQGSDTHQIMIQQQQLVSDLGTLMQEMREQMHTFSTISSPKKDEKETLKMQDTQNQSFKHAGEGTAIMTHQAQDLSHVRDGQVVKIATADDLESLQESVLRRLADISEQGMIQSSELALATCNLQKLDAAIQNWICHLKGSTDDVHMHESDDESRIQLVPKAKCSEQVDNCVQRGPVSLTLESSRLSNDMTASSTKALASSLPHANPVQATRPIVNDNSTTVGIKWLAEKIRQNHQAAGGVPSRTVV